EQATIVIHARLTSFEAQGVGDNARPGAAIKDDFPLDDEAWIVIGVTRKARVLIVGHNNDVLHAFFDDDSTREVAHVTYMSPTDLAKDVYRKPARNGDFDLVIF